METEQPLRQSRPVVAFDFDGTLTIRDSYTAFLRWRAGGGGYVAGLSRVAPDLFAFPFHRDRGRLKAAATRIFLRGAEVARIQAEARRFADEVWGDFMRPDALATWAEWGERGAERVIVTASPELTVRPFAERLGADRLIGTGLEVHGSMLTGRFSTPNCRAGEKVTRLRDVYGPDVRLIAAYGDTSGDIEMLDIADIKGWKAFSARPRATEG